VGFHYVPRAADEFWAILCGLRHSVRCCYPFPRPRPYPRHPSTAPTPPPSPPAWTLLIAPPHPITPRSPECFPFHRQSNAHRVPRCWQRIGRRVVRHAAPFLLGRQSGMAAGMTRGGRTRARGRGPRRAAARRAAAFRRSSRRVRVVCNTLPPISHAHGDTPSNHKGRGPLAGSLSPYGG